MKKILSYTIPIWVSMLINSLLGITDFLFLSSISSKYMTIVGLAYIPFNLITSIFVGLGIEANRIHSKGDKINLWNLIFITIVASTLLFVVIRIFSDYFLFFAWNNEFYTEIQLYFQVLLISIVPTAILFICTGVLRGKGIPEKALYFSVFCVLLNLVFDFLFIKFNVFGNPLIDCAMATVLADSIVAITYISFFIRKKYMCSRNSISLKKFVKNAVTNSIEKVFSVSTLQIISSFFLVKIDITYSAVYFALDRFLQPIQLYSHSFFEWTIYAYSKRISTNKSIYYLYFSITLLIGLLSILYLNTDYIGVIYTFIMIFYVFFFFIERSVIAQFFVHEKGKIVNYISLLKNILFIITLCILTYFEKLSLLSFGITNIFYLLLETIFLISLLKNIKKIENLKTLNTSF